MGSLGAAEDKIRDNWDDLKLSYHSVIPNKWTFESNKIRHWVEARLTGRVLNACAGKTKLTHDDRIIRNDIDKDVDADIHADVCEISDYFEPASFDTVVYDPPYSAFQSSRQYEGRQVGDDAAAKRQFDTLLSDGGTVIQFGFTTTNMPNSLGYSRQEVAVWNTLGRCNDYLSTVDKKPGKQQAQARWFK